MSALLPQTNIWGMAGRQLLELSTVKASTLVSSSLSYKYQPRMEVTDNRKHSRVRIHITSFYSQLRNWPNKLKCLSLVSLSSLVLWSSLAYWADSFVRKKMECCEYGTNLSLYGKTFCRKKFYSISSQCCWCLCSNKKQPELHWLLGWHNKYKHYSLLGSFLPKAFRACE